MPKARSRYDDGVEPEIARDRPGHVVRDGRRADAALGAGHRDHPPDGDRLRCREQAADRAHHVEHLNRPDHVVADAAADQFAIGRDLVADHDHARAGVADGGEFVEPGQEIAGPCGFQHDHVRGRRGVIVLDGGLDAAHVDRKVRFREAAVLACRAGRGRRCYCLAKGLHRDARGRRDIVVGRRRRGVGGFFEVMTGAADHLPVSLSLALSASG